MPAPDSPRWPGRMAYESSAVNISAGSRSPRGMRRCRCTSAAAGRARRARDTILLDRRMPFRAISGHRPLLELLGRATARGTLPPSLIFAGPDGVGKRLTASALAQVLNCDRPVEYGRQKTGDRGSGIGDREKGKNDAG